MNINRENFKAELDEEAEVYSILNGLDEQTTKELNFIINSFAGYYLKSTDEEEEEEDYENSIFSIIESFDMMLETLDLDILNVKLETHAAILYKELPTIKDMISEEIEFMRTEIEEIMRNKMETLRNDNKELRTQLEHEKKINEEFLEEIKNITRKNSALKRKDISRTLLL